MIPFRVHQWPLPHALLLRWQRMPHWLLLAKRGGIRRKAKKYLGDFWFDDPCFYWSLGEFWGVWSFKNTVGVILAIGMYVYTLYIYICIYIYSILFNKTNSKTKHRCVTEIMTFTWEPHPHKQKRCAWWRRTTSWRTSTSLVEKLNKHDKKATWWKNMIIYAWVNYHSFTILEYIEYIVTSFWRVV